jgi:lipopolysaccharide transport system permease protein
MTEIVELWRYREVLLNLVRRNLKVRYKNSLLGFFWSLLNPLFQIGVWYFVFKIIMGNPEPNYMAQLITGFLPWLFFSQTVLDSAACVTQEMALVKKAYFPRAILPISALISNLIHLGLAFVVLIALFALWRVDVNIHYWLVIPSTLLIAVFAYGLSAMVAAWSVYYADVKFMVGTLFGLWFFLTPVLYSISGFLLRPGMQGEANWLSSLIGSALPALKQVYLADPVTIGILGYRSGLLCGGQSPIVVNSSKDLSVEAAQSLQAQLQAQYPLGQFALIAAVIALATALFGHLIYRRLSRQFAERG